MTLVRCGSRSVYEGVVSPPKTNAGRHSIRLSKLAVAALKQHSHQNLHNRSWKPLLERAGLPHSVSLAGLYERRRTSRLIGEKWGFGLTFIGLAIGLIGDVLAYWGGPPGQDFTQMQATGFSIELIGLLLILIGSVVLGVTYLGEQANALPKLVAGLLIAAGPGGFMLFSLHAPSGTLLLFCCAWVVLGYLLLMGRVASAEQPSRVS